MEQVYLLEWVRDESHPVTLGIFDNMELVENSKEEIIRKFSVPNHFPICDARKYKFQIFKNYGHSIRSNYSLGNFLVENATMNKIVVPFIEPNVR